MNHKILDQSTQYRMSHGEISAHKLPQMMIRVVSHEERAYHANSRAQSFHSLHTSLSVEVKRRSLATRPPEGFLQRDCSRILQLTDWETFPNVGPSRCHLAFLGLRRNSHNLQCVPWGRRCQAMIGGFQNGGKKGGRVTQITQAVQEISPIEPY